MSNLIGVLPFSPTNLVAMIKAGALPGPELSDQELIRAIERPEGIPMLATVPSTSGRVVLAAYLQKRLCRVEVFDDPAGIARKAVIAELSTSKVWYSSLDETKEGIHMQEFAWPLKDNISMSINVSGPDTPTDGGKGMQLMITVAYTTTGKPN
ncbi:MAG TPA: hypothetical protein VJM78_08380 [Rhizomicrobium sp.]|nr:hypothetical protein [Rhizomicrobium sp.]